MKEKPPRDLVGDEGGPEPAARRRRARAMIWGLLVAVLLLAGRLAQLQLIHGSELEESARRQRVRPIVVPAPRGAILDREGRVLADSRPAFTASLVFTGGGLDDGTRRLLKDLLKISDAVIDEAEAQLRAYPFRPARLKVDLSPEEHTRLEEMRHQLPGVIVEVLPMRLYPHGPLASHVVGHVKARDQWSVEGAYGIEAKFDGPQIIDDIEVGGLTGTPGRQLVEVDAFFRPHRVLVENAPIPGHDIHLTLDARLQAGVQQALSDQMEALRESTSDPCPCPAPAAAAVVMDAKSGAILAMASEPSFDPSIYTLRPFLRRDDERRKELDAAVAAFQGGEGSPALNRAIQGRYPPGSVFKMITGLSGMVAGIGNSQVYCTGHFSYGGAHVRDWSVHGRVGLEAAVAHSCNVYFWTVGTRVGVEAMGDVAGQFGLDGYSGLRDVDGELPAVFPHTHDPLNTAIGQGGHQYSPLHMAVYVSAIANGGARMRPYLVDRVVDASGEVVYEGMPEVLGVADIEPEQLRRIQEGMRGVASVVQGRGGTAYSRFRDAPYVAAGKTGTVERGRGYSSSENHGWFVGYAPAGPDEDPEIVVSVIVEAGGGGSSGAAPVVRRIMDIYFGLEPSPLDGQDAASGPEFSNSSETPEPGGRETEDFGETN